MKYIILGYLALYWAIWLHEVGHSYMYKKYGCKSESFLKVTVPFYLFFSTPMPIDVEKASVLNKKQIFNVSIAGIAVNMILGVVSTIILSFTTIENEINLTLLYFFAVFNFTEAATYLVINNIFLASDMKAIASYSKIVRIVGFIIGIVASASIIYLIATAPLLISTPLAIGSISIALLMSVARIFFEFKNKSIKSNNC